MNNSTVPMGLGARKRPPREPQKLEQATVDRRGAEVARRLGRVLGAQAQSRHAAIPARISAAGFPGIA